MPSRDSASAASALTVGRTRWWGFWLYGAIALVHVIAIALGAEAIAAPTKFFLMPALAIAAIWALRGYGATWPAAATLLFLALAFSWLGDGAAFFFPIPGAELPVMLLCFGIAHLLYIWIFTRHVNPRALPPWTLVYAVWWGVMLAVLWPHLGALTAAVAVYGLVLAGTAAFSARGTRLTAIGGAVFLVSDTLLALRLFLPGGLPEMLAGPWIMLAYTLGQGLLVLGIVQYLRTTRP